LKKTIVVILLCIILFTYVNLTRTTTTPTNNPTSEKVSKNTVKVENNDILEKGLPSVCSLSTIECNETEVVQYLSNKYNVDWKLIESIVIHETGNRTSKAYKELNNVGGLMRWDRIAQKTKLMQFETVYDSYETMIQIIKKYYLDKGLTTIEQIGEKYAPINASNDSKGLNNHWVEGVKSIYDNL